MMLWCAAAVQGQNDVIVCSSCAGSAHQLSKDLHNWILVKMNQQSEPEGHKDPEDVYLTQNTSLRYTSAPTG